MKVIEILNNVPNFNTNPIAVYGRAMLGIMKIKSDFPWTQDLQNNIKFFLKRTDLSESKTYFEGLNNPERVGTFDWNEKDLKLKNNENEYNITSTDMSYLIKDQNGGVRVSFQLKDKGHSFTLFDKSGSPLYKEDMNNGKQKISLFSSNRIVAEIESPSRKCERISLFNEKGMKFYEQNTYAPLSEESLLALEKKRAELDRS